MAKAQERDELKNGRKAKKVLKKVEKTKAVNGGSKNINCDK